VNFARALIAAPLFFIAVILITGGFGGAIAAFSAVKPVNLGWCALSMFASYGFGDVLFLWSTRSLGVPGALAIASSYPLWTAILGAARGEKITFVQVSGLILTVAGVVLVVLNGPKFPEHKHSKRAIAGGAALAFVASLFWALNSFSVAQSDIGLPALGATAVVNSLRMIIAMILSLIMSRLITPGSPVTLPLIELKRSLGLFVIEAFIGSYFFMYGLSHTPLAIGSALASLAPVLSVPIALALGHEKFSLPRTTGVILVVMGLCGLMRIF